MLIYPVGIVAQVAGLTPRQLEWWDQTEIITPSIAPGGRGRGYRRLYGFDDLVLLFVAARLRDSGVPAQRIRHSFDFLRKHRTAASLRELAFFAIGDRLLTVHESMAPVWTLAEVNGQTLLSLRWTEAAEEVRRRLEALGLDAIE